MSAHIARSYEGASDLPSLIDFAQRVSAARQFPPYYHPGDFVWQLAVLDQSDDVRLWLRDGRVVACAIFEPPITFQFDIGPAAAGGRNLFHEVVTWAEERYRNIRRSEAPIAYRSLGGALSTWAMEDDAVRVALLEESGYARTADGGVRYRQPLDGPIAPTDQAAGATVRRVLPSDVAERVDLHRDAWSVWGESTFSLQRYERLRAAPLYDSELDIVVEFQERLVSYCVCWLDTATRVGYFEPVGTRPAFTGRGFGRAAIIEGLRRMRERGMTVARVGTASVNTGAQRLYQSAGFVEEAREFFYSRRA